MIAFTVINSHNQASRYPAEAVEKLRPQWEPLASGRQTVEAIKILRAGGVDFPTSYSIIHEFQLANGITTKTNPWWKKLLNLA